MFTDSHCHLTFPELASQIERIRADMQTQSVGRALCICTMLEEFDAVHGLVCQFENFWATVGVHPDNEGVREPGVAELVTCAERPKVVAIGETGLDYYRMGARTHADMHWQRERFRVHIRAARAAGLPLVVHTRSAAEDTLAILREESETGAAGSVGGVFHCFTESRAIAEQVLDMGFYIAFSGIVTFKSARELQAVAAWVPLNRLLIETDSPYLAPVPFRGKTNSPALVRHVAEQLARLRGCSSEAIGRATTANFFALFARANALLNA